MSKINDLKQENIQRIRACFYDGNIWTKNDLSAATGLALSSTTNIIQELLSIQEIKYVGQGEATGGRKSKMYRLHQDYQHLMVIYLKRIEQQYAIYCQVFDLQSQPLYKDYILSDSCSREQLKEFVGKTFYQDKHISLLVFSIPGICQNGHVHVCDYPALENYELAEDMRETFGQEVIIENDVNVASIGFCQDYPDCQHIAFLYQPSAEYVGCGMIINRQLYNGFSHFSGELRYLPEYSYEYQKQMLKEDPALLLSKQMTTLWVVMNPEVIGYCSDVFSDVRVELLGQDIEACHYPKIVRVDDFNKYIQNGLFAIGIKTLKERGKRNG